jgi:SagB-type dehydrogenase family enzyme
MFQTIQVFIGRCVIAMSKANMKIQKIITNNSSYWDHTLDKILDDTVTNDVIKFHQSANVIKRDSANNPYNGDTLLWLKNVEHTDVIPNMYISEHLLENIDCNNLGSIRDFDLNGEITYQSMSNIIKKAFGRDINSTSKRYPSGGALYPVIPLICILEDYHNSGLTKGVYVYDSYKHSLKKIKEWNEEEFEDFKSVLNPWEGKVYSNYLIGYAIDLMRAIAKYKKRGYRHALIEVGTMVQALRESLIEEQQNMGDFCWSGFDDNAVTYLMGLNPRKCPVTLIQWFGKKRIF